MLLLVGVHGGLVVWRSGEISAIWDLYLLVLFFSWLILPGTILGNSMVLLIREVRSRRTTSPLNRPQS